MVHRVRMGAPGHGDSSMSRRTRTPAIEAEPEQLRAAILVGMDAGLGQGD